MEMEHFPFCGIMTLSSCQTLSGFVVGEGRALGPGTSCPPAGAVLSGDTGASPALQGVFA